VVVQPCALDALFALASKHSLDVDLHIDETNNEACCGVVVLCRALLRARAPASAGGLGYSGTVVLGHVTSLALQEPSVQADVVARLAILAPVTVVCNPFTNLGLQDRRGTAPPIGAAIDRDAPRTPKWRGLTLVQELRAAVGLYKLRILLTHSLKAAWWSQPLRPSSENPVSKFAFPQTQLVPATPWGCPWPPPATTCATGGTPTATTTASRCGARPWPWWGGRYTHTQATRMYDIPPRVEGVRRMAPNI
jgi:hypothetical protein